MTFEESFKIATALAAVIGCGISLATFIKVVIEYIKQGKLKRAESFSNLKLQLWQNPAYKRIVELLVSKEATEQTMSALRDIDIQDKYAFLAFYEEIALMLNSGLIGEDIAHYMFGYIAIACYDSEGFWSDEDKNDLYWSLFSDFALRIKRVENNFSYSRKRLKF